MVERDFEAMDRIPEAYQASTEVAEWAEYNRRFPLALSAPANNLRLRQLIEECCLNTDRFTHVAMSQATGKASIFGPLQGTAEGGGAPI